MTTTVKERHTGIRSINWKYSETKKEKFHTDNKDLGWISPNLPPGIVVYRDRIGDLGNYTGVNLFSQKCVH